MRRLRQTMDRGESLSFGTGFAFRVPAAPVSKHLAGQAATYPTTPTNMTRRHPMKLRALALAAVACFAVPLIPTAGYGQDEAAPAPTEEMADVAVVEEAVVADEAPAEGTYEAFMAGPDAAMFTVNNLWILIAAALVFIMHLGFSTVESGLCQQKNTVNILFKNVFIVCIGALGYMAYGFNAMYPGDVGPDTWGGFFAAGSPLTNNVRRSRDRRQCDRVASMTGEYILHLLGRLHLPSDVRRYCRHDRFRCCR